MPTEGLTGYPADVSRRLLAEEDAVPWRTLSKAIRKTDELLADLTGRAAALLAVFRTYLVGRAGEAKAIIA